MAEIVQHTKRGTYRRGRQEGWTEGWTESQRGRLVGPYPSHCSHVQLHLIGWFEVSLQEEDGRLDRPVRGYDLCEE